MKKTFLLILSLFLLFPLSAEISFGNPDINMNDEVLFTVRQNSTGANPYKSVFYTKINNGTPESTPKLITCYPEQMELLSGGEVLQLRNRYGTARYYRESGELKWLTKLDRIPEHALPVAPYSVSPDGKFFCRIERTSAVSGCLVLEASESGKSYILSENLLLSYEKVPVKWAPDSSVLIYEKTDGVYFCNPDAILRGVEIEEKYRCIGRGTVNSICWADSKCLAYIDDYLLYKINTRELYTLGLYSGIIGQGKAMGRLPFKFDSKADTFSSNSDVTSIVVCQSNRLFSYLVVQSSSCDYMDVVYSRPYTDSTASLIDTMILWNEYESPILWQEKLPYNGAPEKCAVYRLSTKAAQVLEIQDSGRPLLSPSKSKIAFYSGAILYVYDINSWKRIAELAGEKIASVAWMNEDILCVGGEKSVRLWNIRQNIAETITLSSAIAAYWDSSDYSIVAETNGAVYFRYNKEKNTWKRLSEQIPVAAKNQNGRYRVFTGTTQNKQFKNSLYVRTLGSKAVTKAVFPESTEKSAPLKKVALAFDFYDNADGLPRILSNLKKYNVTGTFFLNGEFIRRYPLETQQIVANGHDCASMFFTVTDLTKNSFVINEEFVRRGLGRNEDEFYEVTGTELSLYWHTPYYAVTPELITYGDNSGYGYVNSFHKHTEFDSPEVRPEVLIRTYYDDIVRQNGGIIPIVGGFSEGYHVYPLYNYLDVLISALIDGGFELVGIEEL